MALRCRRRTRLPAGLVLAAAVAAAALVVPASAAAKPENVKVMTRNVYLGGDLTEGVRASDLQGLVNAAGRVLQQVDQNRFPVRARALAAEIRREKPHLVGLQELALWRTGPCTESPIPPSATEVRYDYLKLLLRRLNRGKKRYRVVISEPQFDFEVYVNTDGDESTAAPGCPLGSELNGRLTMRDAILARRGAVRTSGARGGNFDTLLQVRPAGVPVDVTRGWTRVDARVRSARFRFVNTHLEAFDNQSSNATNQGTEVGNGQIREAQARELLGSGGPGTGRRPVVLLGDLNSDVATEVRPGDALAYQSLLDAGFVSRDTSSPLSCCLGSPLLASGGGGSLGDFDHKVDHVMTDTPRRVRLRRSSVTGLRPAGGFWPSDHAGLVSALRLR